MKDNALLVVAGIGLGFLAVGLVSMSLTIASIGLGVILAGGFVIQILLPEKEERND